MSELFLKILNMSISASWLVLAVLLFRFVFKKAPKWANVLLWGIVALRLILPFSIESALSLIPSAETVPMNIEMAARPAIDSGVGVINSVVNPVLAASFTPKPMTSANPLQILIPVWAIIWLAGSAALLIYTAVSYLRLRRKVREAVVLRDNIYQSENVASPFVLGVIRPKIYLPYNMDGQNMEHVVAHEQAHIRRRDHWWKPLGFLLLTVYWFNPLLWLAYVLLCRDIELACDEKVIRELGNEQRADYTQALLQCSVNRRAIAACPLAFGEVGVKARVKSVLHYKKPAFWLVVAAVVVCVAAAVCFLTNPRAPMRELLKPGTSWACEVPLLQFAVDENHVIEGLMAYGEDNIGISVGYRFAGRNSAVFELFSGDWEWAQKAAEEPLLKGMLRTKNGKLLLEVEKDNLGLGAEQLVFTEASEWRSFRAEVLEIHDGWFLVKPLEGWALSSADQIEVPMRNMEPSPEVQVGDIIEVVCSGEILETYPARLQEVYSIRVVVEEDLDAEEALLEVFRSGVSGDETMIVTDYVLAPDKAYGLDGVVQYVDETGAPWRLAFVRDGVAYPAAQAWDSDYAIVSELMYMGDGLVQTSVENLNDGSRHLCAMAFSYDEATQHMHITSSTEPIELDPYEEYLSAVTKENCRYVDLDGDGAQELFVSWKGGGRENKVLTIVDGEPVVVLSANHLFLCEGGIIGRYSEGAGGQTVKYYRLENHEAVIVDVITTRNDGSWYRGSAEGDQNMTRITEEEAGKRIAQYALLEGMPRYLPWAYEANEAPPITADFASDALLSGKACHEFVAEDSEYAVKLMFVANEALTDVRFSLLTYETDTLSVAEELDAVSELEPGMPYVATVVFYGDMTTYGISFKDAAGNARHFSVHLSGKDGSVLLNEYIP